MNNKLLINITYLAITIFILGMVISIVDYSESDIMINTGATLFLITGGYLLVKNGQFIKTAEFRLTRLGISILLIGVMLKIMHWPFANEILALGFLTFPIIYLIYIIRNRRTEWTSFLKLFFLITIIMGKFFQIIHWPYSEIITLIGLSILLFLVYNFSRQLKFK